MIQLKEKLETLAFFRDFPPEVLDQFIAIGNWRIYEKYETILQQGEVVGEMSLVSDKPCSATIKSQTRALLYILTHESIKGVNSISSGLFEMLLYKISNILVRRLTKTNEKAKRFEIANRKLQST